MVLYTDILKGEGTKTKEKESQIKMSTTTQPKAKIEKLMKKSSMNNFILCAELKRQVKQLQEEISIKQDSTEKNNRFNF